MPPCRLKVLGALRWRRLHAIDARPTVPLFTQVKTKEPKDQIAVAKTKLKAIIASL